MNLLNLQTGKAETPESPLDALAAGTHVPIGGRVLVDPTGQLVVSPDGDVPANLGRYGYRVPTQDQLTEAAKQAKYGEGTGNELRAGLEGAARGASFGLSDVAQRAVGVDPEGLRERRARNPVSAIGGEVAGAVGSAIMAPESLVGKAGQLGEGVAAALKAGALPEGAALAPRILAGARDVGAKALGSSVEGALFGLGENVTEAALGDPDLNAEKFWSNVGIGSLLGGGLGATAGVLGKVVPPAIGKAREAVQTGWRKLFGGEIPVGEPMVGDLPTPPGTEPQVMQATGTDGMPQPSTGTSPDLAPGEAPQAPGGMADSPAAEVPPLSTPNPMPNPGTGMPSPLSIGYEDGIIPRAIAKAKEALGGPDAESTLQDFRTRSQPQTGKVLSDPEFQKLAGQLQESVGSVISNHEQMLKDAISKVRPQEVDSLLANVDPAHARAQLQETKGILQKAINEMRNEPELYPARFPRQLELVLDGLENGTKPEMTAAEAFHELNRTKQILDSKIDWTAELTGDSKAAKSLWKQTVGQVRDGLENEQVWGEAGARQQAFNEAYSEWKKLTGKGSAFRKYFMERVNGEWRPNFNKMRGFLNRINTAEGEMKQGVLRDVFKSAARGVDETEKTYKAAPFERFDADAQREFLGKQQELFHSAEGTIKGQPGMGYGGLHNLIRLGMIGHFGSPVLLASEIAKAMGRHETIASLEKVAGKTTDKVGRAVKALFRPVTENAAKGVGILRDQLTPAEKVERFKKRVDEIQKISGDPTAMIDRLHEATKDGFDAAPQTMQSIQLAALKGTAFLAAKVPRPSEPQLPFDPPYEPTKAEMASFDRYYEAVHNPTVLLSELSAHQVHPETVEAVAAVFPRLYQEMKTEVMTEMTSHMAKAKAPVPYQRRLALSQFLGAPLDHSMTSGVMQAVQATSNLAMAQKEAQDAQATGGHPHPGQMKHLDVASRSLTPFQETAQRTS